MKINDTYRILNLPLDASKEDKKHAYRKLAKLYHPDKNNDEDALQRFIEVGEAYELIISSNNSNSKSINSNNYPKFRHPSYRQTGDKGVSTLNFNERAKQARKLFDEEFAIQSDRLYYQLFNKYKTSYQRKIAIVFAIIGVIISAAFVYDTFGETEDYPILSKGYNSKSNKINALQLSLDANNRVIAKYRYAEFTISATELQILKIIRHSKFKRKLIFVERTKFFDNTKCLKIINPLNNDVFILKTKNVNIEVWIYLIIVLMLFPLFTFLIEKPTFNFVFFAINYNLYGFPVSLLLIIIYATPFLGL